MKYIQIADTLNSELLEKIMQNIIDNDELNIYIDSNGGDVVIGEYLEKELLKKKLLIINVGYAGSMAFHLIYKLFNNLSKNKPDVKINILDTATGYAHITSSNISYGRGGVGMGGQSKLYKQEMETQKPFVYDFLTEEEMKDYLKGNDIFIGYERMKEIFKS